MVIKNQLTTSMNSVSDAAIAAVEVREQRLAEQAAAAAEEEARKKLQNGNRLMISDLSVSDRSAVQLPELETTGEAQRFRVYDTAGKFYGIYGWDVQRKDLKSIKMFL